MSAEYVKKVNDKPLAASEVAPSSPLETTVSGKLNVNGSNATQVGTSAIVKTLGYGSDNIWNGDWLPANGHANQTTNPDDYTLRSTDHLLNFLFREGTGGWNYANLDSSMKKFGHAYGATIDSDAGCYGWKIGETSNTSAYSSAAFKAIVVVWEWDAPNWNHDGYSGRNFVGVLDIVHRMTGSTVSDSADKKIGTLTCICPMYCENSNGNRGYTVFVKQAAGTHKAEWYIGRNTASVNMNSKIQYGRLSIFPIMEYRWKKFMVQQNSSISFNSDMDEYWGNRNVPFFSYSNYSGVGSTTRPVYIKANGEFGQCDPSSATTFFVANPSDMPSNGSIASEAKTHWTNMATPDGQMVYNNRGDEYSMIFSRYGNYGSIVRWTYYKPYFEMLRNYNNTWRTTDWEPVMTPCVLTLEYSTDTSEKASIYSQLVAWRTTTTQGSSTKTRHPIVFLYKDDNYYAMSDRGSGGGQGGGSAMWHFTRVVGSSVDRVSFTATWDNGGNYTYSWGTGSGVANDVSPKHLKSTYYSSDGNQTIDISTDTRHYEVQLNSYASSVTIDLDCSVSSTCTAIVKLVDKITAAQCGGLYIRWRDECGAYHRYLFDHMSSSTRDPVGLQVSIKKVTFPTCTSPTYAVARVTLIPGEYNS